MARQVHIAQEMLGSIADYSTPGVAAIILTSSDVPNKEQTKLTGKEMLLIRNLAPGTETVSIDSVEDEFGRTKNITNYSLSAGENSLFGPFAPNEWAQPDGNLFFSTSDLQMLIAVLRIPG